MTAKNMTLELTLEDCDVLAFPKSDFHIQYSFERTKEEPNFLFLDFEIPDSTRGSCGILDVANVKTRLKYLDITHIDTGNGSCRVPWRGTGESNLIEGLAFDGNTVYIAFGEKDVLLRQLRDISGKRKIKFLEAIDNLGKILPLDTEKSQARIYSPEEAIAQILAEHFSRIDKPKGGWQAEGENPYTKILEQMTP